MRSRIFPPKIVKLTNKVIHTPSNWYSKFPNTKWYKRYNKSRHNGKNGSCGKGSNWIASIETERKWWQQSRKFFSFVRCNVLILLIILPLYYRLGWRCFDAEKRTKLNSSLKHTIRKVKFLSKNSILTKKKLTFSRVFHPNFF